MCVCNTDFFSHDITQYNLGGPWYTEQEFDHEFVEELCNFIVQFVNSKGMIDLSGRGTERKRECLWKRGRERVCVCERERETVIES